MQLFSKMLVFFEEINNFPEIAVIMQSSVLKKERVKKKFLKKGERERGEFRFEHHQRFIWELFL